MIITDIKRGFIKTQVKGGGITGTIPILPNGEVFALGDSIVFGQGATTYAQSYAGLLTSYVSGTVNNLASGGSGVFIAADISNGRGSLINPNIGSTGTNLSTGLFIIGAGLNDYRRSGVNTKTDNKVVGCITTCLINALAKKYYFYDNFTPTGSWSVFPVNVYRMNPSSSNPCVYNASGAGTLTITASGKNFGFCFMGDNGASSFGTVTITIDGVLQKTVFLDDKYDGISDGTNANVYGPYSVAVFGLAAGNHTIVISGTINTPFNFMCELTDPTSEYTNPCLVMGMDKLDTAGYAISPSSASDAIIAAGNILIQGVASSFSTAGFPVKFVDVSSLDVNTQLADHIHPNDSGHTTIYNLAKAKLSLQADSRLFNNMLPSGGHQYMGYFSGTYFSRLAIGNDWQAYGGATALQATGDCSITFTCSDLSMDWGGVGFNTTREVATYTAMEYGAFWFNSGNLYSLLNGAATLRQSGPLVVNSKIKLKRASGTITLEYAADGTNFSVIYTFLGTNNSTLYPNIAMTPNKNAYGINSTGFV